MVLEQGVQARADVQACNQVVGFWRCRENAALTIARALHRNTE